MSTQRIFDGEARWLMFAALTMSVVACGDPATPRIGNGQSTTSRGAPKDASEGSPKDPPATTSSPDQASEKSDWIGLYASESSDTISALNIKSEEPFVFAISIERNGFPPVDASELVGTFDDADRTSVTFTRDDCTLTIQKGSGGISAASQSAAQAAIYVEQKDWCTSLRVDEGFSLDTMLLKERKRCWDLKAREFKAPGTCVASPGF